MDEKILSLLRTGISSNVELALLLLKGQKGDVNQLKRLVKWYFGKSSFWEKLSFEEKLGELFEWKNLTRNHLKLEMLPEELSLLSHIEILTLSGNCFVNLPDVLLKLGKLQVLDMSKNEIRTLPEQIDQLSNLKELDLSDNQLRELPFNIGKLAALETLDLANNPLQEVPLTIANLSNLRHFNIEMTYLSVSQRVEIRYLLPDCKLYY